MRFLHLRCPGLQVGARDLSIPQVLKEVVSWET